MILLLKAAGEGVSAFSIGQRGGKSCISSRLDDLNNIGVRLAD